MKKRLVIIFVVVAISMFTACNSNKPDNADNTQTDTINRELDGDGDMDEIEDTEAGLDTFELDEEPEMYQPFSTDEEEEIILGGDDIEGIFDTDDLQDDSTGDIELENDVTETEENE